MRLIDAGDVMDAVFNAIDIDEEQWNKIKQEVDEIPTVDPESLRPAGKWILTKTNICGVNRYECSCCHEARYHVPNAWENRMKYCACCGARMNNGVGGTEC